MPPSPDHVLLATAGLSCLQTGLQWYTQTATYPLFHALPADAFTAYHRAYERRLPATIYGPYAALVTGGVLSVRRARGRRGRRRAAAALALNGSIMAASLALAVPVHRRLDRDGPSPALLDRLVRLNALRLAASAAASLLALGLVADPAPATA